MEKYIAMVEKHRQLILDALDYIWANPEIGYKEWKTHKYLKDAFEKLGYTLNEAGNIPGFVTTLDTGRPGPTVLVFGEMDGLTIPDHPAADPETGAVHACGHCCQVAALLGLAAALKEPGALDAMSGKIMLCAVPAEELIDLEDRQRMRNEGLIKYFGGKPEFLYRGLLDGADLAFMVHTSSGTGNSGISGGSNGMVAKSVAFEGVSAHAGGSPHKGINALYAANIALTAINALRETFEDKDHIRVHPVITNGGASVNAIPDLVTLESYIRGADLEKIDLVNKKVNRAISAAAAAMGGNVRITDFPGYMPRRYPQDFIDVYVEAFGHVSEVKYNPAGWGTGCSDMGDITTVMPGLHPFVGGATGSAHGINYQVTDPDTACVLSAKGQLLLLLRLLENGAEKAKSIVANYQPLFASKEEYFAFADSMNVDKKTVIYEEDGTVTLNFTN